MISVCIATFRRENQLERLLRVLVQEIARPEPIEIVVCDNSVDRSAESVVIEVSRFADIEIRYYCEPEQNISLARNKTVLEAKGEWIAFIDDDELPDKNWLVELYQTIKIFHADAAFGPVVPIFQKGSDLSLIDMGFYEPLKMATGTTLKMNHMASNNVMLSSKILLRVMGPFERQYGLSGGEDTLLFGTLLHQHHCYFVWCAEAVVYESLPLSRCTIPWLIKRAFRGGQGYADIERKIRGNSRYIIRIISALVILPMLVLLLPILYFINRSHFHKLLIKAVSKAGQLSSVLQWRYKEYA